MAGSLAGNDLAVVVRMAAGEGRSLVIREIVDLEACDPEIGEFLPHPEMLGVTAIGFERGAVGELADQDKVAGIVDFADVDADLDMGEALDPAPESFESSLDLGAGIDTRLGRVAAHAPHHDVTDRTGHKCFLDLGGFRWVEF